MTEMVEKPLTIAGQGIKVVENPNNQEIKKLNEDKLTGLSHHPKRQQSWDVWHRGAIIKFTETKGEALDALKEEFKRERKGFK